jgi:hypothetical protein
MTRYKGFHSRQSVVPPAAVITSTGSLAACYRGGMDDVRTRIPDLRDVPLAELVTVGLDEAFQRVIPAAPVTVAPGAKFGSAI